MVDCPGDFVGAFTRLPVRLQELFVQGYQSYLFNRFLSERIERQVLEAEGVEKSSFRVNAIPRISGKGQLRALVSPVKDFKVHRILHSKENLNEHQVELSFMLLRGSYATMLLREIMKPRNSIAAGF